MPSIRIDRLSFAHPGQSPLLASVSLHLTEGWTGLVGDNGAGKTTLLRLLAGELTPSAGQIRIEPPGEPLVLCPQSVEELDPSVLDLAHRQDRDAHRVRGRLRLEAEGLARWPSLSPGERKRWQIGSAIATQPRVLLLDEPTNHVDLEARRLLLEVLRTFTGLGVVISHDRTLLDEICTHTLRLHRGAADLCAGSYSRVREAWEAEGHSAQIARASAKRRAAAAHRRLHEARASREAASRSMSGRTRDPKDHDARSAGAKFARASAEKKLGKNVGRLRSAEERALASIPDGPERSALGRSVFVDYVPAPKPTLMSLDRDELRAGSTTLVRNVHLQLRREDRVRLCGPNGAGKTTLLRALLEGSALPPDRVLSLPQELEAEPSARLLDEVRRLDPAVRGRVLSMVAALGSDPSQLLSSTAPSPGETRKLQLAIGLGRHVWALILDEPTNHLDLPTIERLEQALIQYPGALIMVTHDETFATRSTSQTWEIREGRIETS